MASEQDASSRSENLHVSCRKEARTLSTLHGIANCVKNGTTRKIASSNGCQQQCRPQLLSVKFENLVHSIFRNENSTLEINVSHFGVLHWKNAAKNMKRDFASAYIQMRHDNPLPLHAAVRILDDPPSLPPPVAYVFN